MRVTIDRFENGFAVCETENKEIINIEKFRIPSQAKEGYVLKINKEIIEIDMHETEKRKKEIQNLMDDLWE